MEKKKRYRDFKQFVDEHYIMTYANQDGAIDTVDLRTNETTDDVLALLSDLPDLKTISLQGTKITDQGLLNISKLEQIEHLDLRCCQRISDAGMKHVGELHNLKSLELYDTRIGDSGINHLSHLEDLENLNIHSTKITDSGICRLQNYPRLKTLNLGGAALSDDCLHDVGKFERLNWLDLSESKFSDHGIAQLGNLIWLTHLSIAWTRINGAGIKFLSNLSKLEWLHANKSRFSDDSLTHLAPLKRLRYLDLCNTRVTDAGLGPLKTLPRLKDLALEGTRVTKKGKAELKAALPRCVIVISVDKGAINAEQIDDDYFWSHPPRCVEGFTIKAQRECEPTTYQIACSCGCDTGKVFGFPLSRYNKEASGDEFVGPLSFRCSECRKTTEIIDTDVHGYNGELGSSSTVRGKGKRVGYRCVNCRSNLFHVTVHFQYDGAEVDLKQDEPSIAVEDFFGGFSARAACVKCGTRNSVAAFECA